MPQPTAEPGTHALVLAAGAARRVGGGKLVTPFEGRPLIRWAVAAALATRAESVTIVLGADADRISSALADMDDPRLRTCVCPNWDDGLSASLRCGLDSLPAIARALLIFLGDMPRVSSALADELLASVLAGAPAALPIHQGQPGHPVAIGACLFPALRTLTGDMGAGRLLRTMPGVIRIETPDRGAVTDIDTVADLHPPATKL